MIYIYLSKFCIIYLVIIDGSLRSYNLEDDGQYKQLAQFDCRGCVPIKFEPIANFACKNSNCGKYYENVNVSNDDWVEFDEESGESMGVYDFKSRFIK